MGSLTNGLTSSELLNGGEFGGRAVLASDLNKTRLMKIKMFKPSDKPSRQTQTPRFQRASPKSQRQDRRRRYCPEQKTSRRAMKPHRPHHQARVASVPQRQRHGQMPASSTKPVAQREPPVAPRAHYRDSPMPTSTPGYYLPRSIASTGATTTPAVTPSLAKATLITSDRQKFFRYLYRCQASRSMAASMRRLPQSASGPTPTQASAAAVIPDSRNSYIDKHKVWVHKFPRVAAASTITNWINAIISRRLTKKLHVKVPSGIVHGEKSRGYAIVTFLDAETAKKAIDLLNRARFSDGRFIYAAAARPWVHTLQSRLPVPSEAQHVQRCINRQRSNSEADIADMGIHRHSVSGPPLVVNGSCRRLTV